VRGFHSSTLASLLSVTPESVFVFQAAGFGGDGGVVFFDIGFCGGTVVAVVVGG
jgi:hypothetical protein